MHLDTAMDRYALLPVLDRGYAGFWIRTSENTA
jgi:hypothetical protein